MDHEDRAAAFGVLGGELYFVVKWQYQKCGVNLTDDELFKLGSLFGSTGCLGGLLAAVVAPASWPLPVSSLLGGIIFSFFLLTCSQLLGEEKPPKLNKGYTAPFPCSCTKQPPTVADTEQRSTERDVNMVPVY